MTHKQTPTHARMHTHTHMHAHPHKNTHAHKCTQLQNITHKSAWSKILITLKTFAAVLSYFNLMSQIILNKE